jgi:hypothetical protein
VEAWRTGEAAPLVDLTYPCSIVFDAEGHAFVIACEMRTMAVFDPAHWPIGAWVEPDELPFGASHAFGPDGRLYALAGGRRWAGTAVDRPDDILVMEVALPPAE